MHFAERQRKAQSAFELLILLAGVIIIVTIIGLFLKGMAGGILEGAGLNVNPGQQPTEDCTLGVLISSGSCLCNGTTICTQGHYCCSSGCSTEACSEIPPEPGTCVDSSDCGNPECCIYPFCTYSPECTGSFEQCPEGTVVPCILQVEICTAQGQKFCDGEGGYSECNVLAESSENGMCTDNIDNDCVNGTDCEDPGCTTDPACSLATGSIVLVNSDGTANAEIVYQTGDYDIPKGAAEELKTIIQKISGVTLNTVSQSTGNYDVEIHVGKTAALTPAYEGLLSTPLEDYTEDSYTFMTQQDGTKTYIFLLANPNAQYANAGARFAARGFAQGYLGVRWFMPGDNESDAGNYWSYYPQSDTVAIDSIPITTHFPAFGSRHISGANLGAFPADIEWYNRNLLYQRDGGANGLHNESAVHGIPENQHIIFTDLSRRDQAKTWLMGHSAGKYSLSLGVNDTMNYNPADYYPAGTTSATKSVFDYTNYAAQGVPNLIVVQLAYQNTGDPENSPQLEDNVLPYLTMDTSFWVNSAQKSANENQISGWKQKSQNLGLYDYYYGGTMLIPRFNPQTIKESISEFNTSPIKNGFYAEAYPIWALDGFKNYIAAKLLWDTTIDPQTLIDDFCAREFESAAPFMKGYFSELESIWMDAGPADVQLLMSDASKGIGLRTNVHQLEILAPQKIAQLKAILENAKLATQNQNVIARINTIETYWNYLNEWSITYHEIKSIANAGDDEILDQPEQFAAELVDMSDRLTNRPDLAAISTLAGTTLQPRVEGYAATMQAYQYEYGAAFTNAMHAIDVLADNDKLGDACAIAKVAEGASISSTDKLDQLKIGLVVKYLDRAGEATPIPIPDSDFEVANIDELKADGWSFVPEGSVYQSIQTDATLSSKVLSLGGIDRWAFQQPSAPKHTDAIINLTPNQNIEQGKSIYLSSKMQKKRTFERPQNSRQFITVKFNGSASKQFELNTGANNQWSFNTVLIDVPAGLLSSVNLKLWGSDQYDSQLGQTAEQSDQAQFDDIELGIVELSRLQEFLDGSATCEGSTPPPGAGFSCDAQNCTGVFEGAETIAVTVPKANDYSAPITVSVAGSQMKLNLDSYYSTSSGNPIWTSANAPNTKTVSLGTNKIIVNSHWNSYDGTVLDKAYELSFTGNGGIKIKTSGNFMRNMQIGMPWPLLQTKIGPQTDGQGTKLGIERLYLTNGYVATISNQNQPDAFMERGTGSNQIANRYFGAKLSNGIYELQTMDVQPAGFLFSPQTGTYTLTQSDYEPEYVLYFSKQGINRNLLNYGGDISVSAPSTFSEIAGKLVLYGDDTLDFQIMKSRGGYPPAPANPQPELFENLDYAFFEEFTQRGAREFVWITQMAGCMCTDYWNESAGCNPADFRNCDNPQSTGRMFEREYFDDYDAVYMPYTNQSHIRASYDPIACSDVAYELNSPWDTIANPDQSDGAVENFWAVSNKACYNSAINTSGNPPYFDNSYRSYPSKTVSYIDYLGGTRKFFITAEQGYSREQSCNLQTVEGIKSKINAQGVFLDVTGTVEINRFYNVLNYSGTFDDKGLKCSPVDLRNYQFQSLSKPQVQDALKDYTNQARARFGYNVPIYTEQGQDYLVGSVDGFLSSFYQPNGIQASDWDFYPLTPVIHHNRLSFGGAGRIFAYKSEGGGERNFYDYMTASMLFGSPGFIDIYGYALVSNTANPIDTYQEAMEMYYLTQALGKNVAMKKMSAVDEQGSIHRYKVTYENGTEIYINRDEGAWAVQGFNLPQYGVYANGNGLAEYYAQEGNAKLAYVNNLSSSDSHKYVYVQVDNGTKSFPEAVLSAGSEKAGIAIKKNVGGNDLVVYETYKPVNGFKLNLSALGISGTSCTVKGIYGHNGTGYSEFDVSSHLEGNQLVVDPYSGKVWRHNINCQ